MDDSNLILNLPFDESDGSAVAYDYSKSKKNAVVTDCDFVAGKIGKAIQFDGKGWAQIDASNIDLTNNLTVLSYIKSKKQILETERTIGLFINYGDGAGEFVQRYYSNVSDTWVYWAIVKDGLTVRVYKDAELLDTIELPQNPIGIAINQNVYETEYGYGWIDETKIYSSALTVSEIIETLSSVKKFAVYVNGYDIASKWGIIVSESDGILDRPKLKTPLKMDWPSYHGEVVDLYHKRVQSREITLKCWMRAAGKIDFVTKWNDFISQFEGDDTVRLMIAIHPTKPLVFEVYLEDALTVSKSWNDELMVGTFTLKIKEPDPVKKVIRFLVSDTTEDCTLKLNSDKIITVAWGDGTFSNNVYGDHTGSNGLVHHYSQEGVYYAIVSGVIEDITGFETSGIVVWVKI